MTQNKAPNQPNAILPFVEKGGILTRAGLEVLNQMWKQVAGGFHLVPCTASGTNVITLVPTISDEGGNLYVDHLTFVMTAAATSTGPVTALVSTDRYGALAELKVYKTGGSVQADTGDIVLGNLYFLIYSAALDSGAGGFVAK